MLALALLTLAGCGSEGVASLVGVIEKPSLEVTRSVVGADAAGGFELMLSLGEYAGGPTEVSLGAFAIERDGTELYSPLALDSGTPFPVTIGVGDAKRIALSFDVSPDLPTADALCAGPLAFRGSVSDTLGKNRPTTLHSSELTPTCTGP
jgi:hypothetical protein